MDQSQIQKAMHLERQYNELEQHYKFIEQEIVELYAFLEQLETFKNSNSKKGFSSLGKGVCIESEYTSKELLVEVGMQIYVKKTPSEVQEIVETQIKKLHTTKNSIEAQLQLYLQAIGQIVSEEGAKTI